MGQGQTAFAYLFDRAAPHLENAGTMGAGMMTYLHIALFFIAFIGGLVYAAGRHEIDGAFHNAEDFEHNEEDGSVLPEEDA